MLIDSPPANIKAHVAEIVRMWDDPRGKLYAPKMLAALGPAGIEALITLIQEDVQRHKRFVYPICFVVLIGAGILFLIGLQFPQSNFGKGSWFYLLMLMAFCFASMYSAKNTAAKILAKHDDERIAGVLAQAWEVTMERKAITKALTRLLPCLKASDKDYFSAEQKQAIYKLLESKEEALLLAVLKSLEQIGDGSALPYVEKLANPPPRKPVSAKVQAAAQACLPFLTQCAEKEQYRQTLLRASGIMATRPEEMLRPASAASETEPHTLLRATHSD